MEKQYLGITDPAAIINGLAARIADVESQLAYQRETNATLLGENATLREETKRLQRDIDENAKARRLEL